MNRLFQPRRAASSARAHFLRGACSFFFAIGILALGYAGFVFADSHAYQALEMKKFKQAGRLTEPHVPVEGDVLGEIQVPRLGINVVVVQGDSHTSLQHAVGHLAKSALPGEWGNVALAGHRDTFFRPLREIQVGDEIRFNTSEQTFEYVVESIEIVAPTDMHVVQATTGHDLTFITCFPFYYVGPAPKRFIVHARQADAVPWKQATTE
jgi:sortase A